MKNSVFAPVMLMVLIFLESSIPMDGGSDKTAFLTNFSPVLQNFLHIPLYAFLAFLWHRYLCTKHLKFSVCLVIAFLIPVLYGVLDEIHQAFVPRRFGSAADIYLNTAGTVVGVWLGVISQKKRDKAEYRL